MTTALAGTILVIALVLMWKKKFEKACAVAALISGATLIGSVGVVGKLLRAVTEILTRVNNEVTEALFGVSAPGALAFVLGIIFVLAVFGKGGKPGWMILGIGLILVGLLASVPGPVSELTREGVDGAGDVAGSVGKD